MHLAPDNQTSKTEPAPRSSQTWRLVLSSASPPDSLLRPEDTFPLGAAYVAGGKRERHPRFLLASATLFFAVGMKIAEFKSGLLKDEDRSGVRFPKNDSSG